jgi:hypothetical protein
MRRYGTVQAACLRLYEIFGRGIVQVKTRLHILCT